ncbi:hypothetical protein KGQ72_01270 [Patescibacteria group bacterium]|nr:hypothetical protein [Patescibacteria group bacterium]
MAFPYFHSGFEKQALKNRADMAVAMHNKLDHLLSEEEVELRNKKHTGVELSGPELAYLQHNMFERIETLRTKVSALERAIGERTIPNVSNAEEDLQKSKKELEFLQHNFAEKLFQKTGDTDNEVAI